MVERKGVCFSEDTLLSLRRRVRLSQGLVKYDCLCESNVSTGTSLEFIYPYSNDNYLFFSKDV